MEPKPCVFIPKKVADDSLSASPTQGKRNMEPFHAFAKEYKVPIDILEDKEFTGNVEIHRHEADLFGCIEGEVTFVVGGTAVDPRIHEKNGVKNDLELRSTEIKGGEEYVLHIGDWLWIPAGQPHQHKTQSMARLWVIKIPTTAIVPLEHYNV